MPFFYLPIVDLGVKKNTKKNSVFPLTFAENKLVGRYEKLFLFFYFFSRKKQGQACNFMKIQVFC